MLAGNWIRDEEAFDHEHRVLWDERFDWFDTGVFGNVALAVANAKAHRRVERVAIVDWDVHHGNGTQDAGPAAPDATLRSVTVSW